MVPSGLEKSLISKERVEYTVMNTLSQTCDFLTIFLLLDRREEPGSCALERLVLFPTCAISPPPSKCDYFKIWSINNFSVFPTSADKYFIAFLEIFEFLVPID
jgi:hypothetical protein